MSKGRKSEQSVFPVLCTSLSKLVCHFSEFYFSIAQDGLCIRFLKSMFKPLFDHDNGVFEQYPSQAVSSNRNVSFTDNNYVIGFVTGRLAQLFSSRCRCGRSGVSFFGPV